VQEAARDTTSTTATNESSEANASEGHGAASSTHFSAAGHKPPVSMATSGGGAGGPTASEQAFGGHQAAGHGAADAAKAQEAGGILYVGMNSASGAEANTLRHGSPHEQVTELNKVNAKGIVTDGKGQHDDLNKPDGIAAFLATVNCTPEQRKQLEAVLASVSGGGSRDEFRQIIVAYANADHSGSGMRRVVLSGHGDADDVVGDNGDVPFSALEQLARIFPRAAAQVEDLLVASCYSGGEVAMGQPDAKDKNDPDASVNYHNLYPNLKTILAYSGTSPSVATGSLGHIGRWEKATQGKDVKNMDVELMDGLNYGENVSTWDSSGGYHTQSDAEEDGARSLMVIIHRDDAMVAAYDSGQKECTDPHSGELKVHYDYLQKALGNKSISESDRAWCRQQRDVIVRLRYYHTIRKHFADCYGGELRAGYEAVGRHLPDYGTLSRKLALGEIESFLASEQGGSQAVQRCGQLLLGLKDLSATVLPFDWVA
jgi:hypothetical protein